MFQQKVRGCTESEFSWILLLLFAAPRFQLLAPAGLPYTIFQASKCRPTGFQKLE